MKLFITLGNQLFPLKYLSRFKNDHLFFMAEDYGLCTYEKHHKLKILLFLSSMRSYADNLKKNSFKLIYSRIDSADFKSDYLTKIQRVVKKYKIKKNEIAFLSSNTWDVSGGGNYGFNSIWVNRNNNIFDELDYKPIKEIKSLNILNDFL